MTANLSAAVPFSEGSLARAAAARNPWVDVGKGLLIVLVVLGHLVGGLAAAGLLGSSPFWGYLYQWIYAFHMPAFMMLAGLFLERSLRVGFPAFVAEKARSLYYPRVLWGLIYLGLLILMARYANSKPDPRIPWRLLYDPLGDFWFLMTLFVLSVLYAALRAARVPQMAIGLGAILAAVAAQFLGSAWAPVATHLCWYAGWLMVGVLSAGLLLSERVSLRQPPTAVLWAGAILGWGVMTLQLPRSQDGPPLIMLPWAIPGTIAVLACSLALGRAAAGGKGPLALLSRGLVVLGQQSLQIYLVSGIGSVGARVLLTRFLHVDAAWALLAGGMIAGIGLPLLLNWACERVGFPFLFRFGRRKAIPGSLDRPTDGAVTLRPSTLAEYMLQPPGSASDAGPLSGTDHADHDAGVGVSTLYCRRPGDRVLRTDQGAGPPRA